MLPGWSRVGESTMPDTYWRYVYWPKQCIYDHAILTRKKESGYFVSPNMGDIYGEDDIGPFASFEAAVACFATVATNKKQGDEKWLLPKPTGTKI